MDIYTHVYRQTPIFHVLGQTVQGFEGLSLGSSQISLESPLPEDHCVPDGLRNIIDANFTRLRFLVRCVSLFLF